MSAVAPAVTRRDLFFGFLEIGLSGFGGVLPWARRVLVERRRWLSESEFVEVLSLGQALPGPNVINASVVIGARFHGAVGSAIAVAGLLCAPLVIVLLLAVLYTHYGHLDAIRRIFSGVAAAAAGLVLATGIKMAIKLPRGWVVAAITACTFVGAAWLRLPLYWILAAMVPLSIALAWRSQR
jgi:chromate transporter